MLGKKKHKVLVSDPVSEQGIHMMREVAQVDVNTGLSQQELVEIIGAYDALMVRSGTQVTAEIIEAGHNLKVIGRAGVGVDNIDVDKATELGILVINAPEGNTISAAEHTLALMLAMARNVPNAAVSLKQGQWQRSKFMGVELMKKTLGIIGLGRIGSEVARRARAFGMNIMAYDPYISTERTEKLGVQSATLDDIFQQADFITLHAPKTSSKNYLVGAEELSRMKDGVRIINCARGGLIDEKALYEALVSGKVAAAALDVFEEEPPKKNPLLELEQVIPTPHLGASTQEAQVNVAVQVADQIIHVLKGEPVDMAVNVFVIPQEVLSEVEPFIPLMKTMGSFYMQVFNGRVEKIEIIYSGDISEYPVTPLTTALLIGFLRVMLNSTVNFVNAPIIAKNRGIQVKETRSKSTSIFHNLVTVHVTTGEGVFTLAGTVFEGGDIRIVQIGDYRIEVVPSKYMLVNKYVDKPGVIGKVGTILGNNDVNIASMQVGRQKIGGEAVMVLQIDNLVTEAVLQELEKIDAIISTCFVEVKDMLTRS